jgi:hypothetical protein
MLEIGVGAFVAPWPFVNGIIGKAFIVEVNNRGLIGWWSLLIPRG